MLFRPELGLTLGGGGARGGAHIGVWKVLTELGYQPGVVVGASMGGIIAAMIGAGWSLEDMVAFLCDADFAEMIYLDRTGGGLVGTERFADELRSKFGNSDLRDLSPRTAVVATDARTRRRLILDKGPIVKALLATSAVPGLFPPVQWDDYLLVDGGVSDNVPTQATYQLGAERIVAVDISEDVADPALAMQDMGEFNAQLQRAFYWLLSLSRRQTAFDMVLHSMAYGQALVRQYHLTLFPPDVLIHPELSDIGLFSMERLGDAIARGEDAARAAAPLIGRLLRPRWIGKRISNHWPPLTLIDSAD